MRFYIGSGLGNFQKVRACAQALEAMGWIWTCDWTKYIREDGPVDLQTVALAEKQGIAEADIVVILLPAGRGSHVELGMALALGKPVVLWTEQPQEFQQERTVSFYELPGVVKMTGTMEEMTAELARRYGKR